MIFMFALALWAMSAPSGYIVGELARDHYKDDDLSGIMPWICAAFPPLAAIVALTLIMKENTK